MHEEILTKEALALFPSLARFEGYYLVGGTALALHIGHRISVDFDLFCPNELDTKLLARAKRAFSGHTLSVTYAAPEHLNIIVDGVRVTFLYYPYPVLESFVQYQNVPLASIREIATMKAFAVGKRLAYKDYVDWYFLLRGKHVELAEVIALAQRKFGSDFNDRLFLGQLVSFDDVPDQKISFAGASVARTEIERYLEETVRGIAL